MTTDPLAAALEYAPRDWACFPLIPGRKEPVIPAVHPEGHPLRGVCQGECGREGHGLYDAVTDPETIKRWWTRWPSANIGLRTGIDFDMLDIDGPDCLDALEHAGAPGDPDIEGPTVASPRGWHVYVSPTGRGNKADLGGLSGVDWRGVGGYAVAPPSRKANGTGWDWILTGGTFDLGPDTPIEPAPAWVMDLFDPTRPTRLDGPTRHGGRTGYGAAALERELGRLVLTQEGGRNDQLNRSAFSLGQLIATGDLDLDEVGNALLAAALRIGLGERESTSTIKSGLRSGLTTPRTRKVA